jgi:hypothetical protein
MQDEAWYPASVRVGDRGTPGTYRFLESIYDKNDAFTYAEFGIYRADTARNVAERFPNATLYLFDFHEAISKAATKLGQFPNKIYYYGNTQRYHDSYNWNLMKIIEENPSGGLFDYCFLDGAHTFSVDALNYFLCERLLKPGGHIDFDDYEWRLRGSSLDPSKVPSIALQYTDEQIDAFQVKMIVDGLVRTSGRYEEVVQNKIFRKKDNHS